MKKLDKEEIKKEIGILEIEELITIIKTEPLIKDEERKNLYSKKQQIKIKEKLVEIARLCLDLAEIERESLIEKNYDNIIEILKSLM